MNVSVPTVSLSLLPEESSRFGMAAQYTGGPHLDAPEGRRRGWPRGTSYENSKIRPSHSGGAWVRSILWFLIDFQ